MVQITEEHWLGWLSELTVCRAPMRQMATLPAIGALPAQRVFKCTACKFVVAETEEQASAS
jgi:hypothetical protein